MDDTFSVNDAAVIRDSGKALLFKTDDLGEVWVPKSVIHDDSEVWEMGQDPGTLVVQGWWAQKQGW